MGQTALSRATRLSTPDLVFSDVMMLNGCGLSYCGAVGGADLNPRDSNFLLLLKEKLSAVS